MFKLAWCLIKSESQKVRKALRDGVIDPNKLAEMTSKQRREFLKKFVSEDNAKKINSIFESKLLLKNRKAGMITWAKKITGIKTNAKRDLISQIERMDERILDPKANQQFLEDLASQRLGVNVTQAEAKKIAEMSKKVEDSKKVWNDKLAKHPEWSEDSIKTKKEWLLNTERLKYGANLVNLESYIGELKLQAKKPSFKGEALLASKELGIEAGGALKSAVASMDDSLWGRQGVLAALDPRTTAIFTRNFLKSFKNIGNQLTAKGKFYKSGDDAVMDAIKADIYSRPNAMNGKYKAGKYGLDVLSEEAFPSSFPERIPALGRLFKASEVAYNGGALQLRADLADRVIGLAEREGGINLLDPDEARPIGRLVSSFTGRGSLGKAEVFGKELNVAMFSAKFLVGNINSLLAVPQYVGLKILSKLGLYKFPNKGTEFARKEFAKQMARAIAVVATILTILKALYPDRVETDRRGTNFGRIKIFGRWTDITGGRASLIVLASRITPSKHEGEWGFWYKSSSGKYTKLATGEYGGRDPLDVIYSFLEGKAAPILRIVIDRLKNQTFSGEPLTIKGQAVTSTTPISVQTLHDLLNSPDASSADIIGSMILEGLGLSVSTYPESNKQSGFIPEDTIYNEGNFLSAYQTYSKAFEADSETAWNRIFSGQKIMQVSGGGIIVVDKQSIDDSEAFKKAWVKEHGGSVKAMKEVRLDHIIPNKLGGEEKPSNWQVVPKSVWASYTKTENALIKAVKEGKISLKDAQAEIIEFKGIAKATKREDYGDELRDRLKETEKGAIKKKLLNFSLVRKAFAAEKDNGKKIGEQERRWYKTALKLREENPEWYEKNVGRKGEMEMFGFELGPAKVKPKTGRNLIFKSLKSEHYEPSKSAIKKASEEYKVPLDLLMDIAFSESSLNAKKPPYWYKKEGDKTIKSETKPKGSGWTYTTASGLFQFNDATWGEAEKSLGKLDRYNAEDSAKAAAWFISRGYLGKWNASKNKWGKYYKDKELEIFY